MKRLNAHLYCFQKSTLLNILMLSLGIFIFSFPAPSSAQSDFELEIDLLTSPYFDYPDDLGLATITYTAGDSSAYLSIGAQDDATGQFGIIVDHVYLPGKHEEDSPVTLTVPFNLTRLSPHNIQQGVNKRSNTETPSQLTCYIHLFFQITAYPYPASTWLDTKTVQVDTTVEDAVGIKTTEPVSQDVQASPAVINVDDSELRASYHRRVPNLDLDDSQHGDTETYAGDLNACAPTATANSMVWLQAENEQVQLSGNLTLRDIMQDLSDKFNRERNEGTGDNNQQKGTLDFVEDYDLPIEVKFQSKWEDGNIQSSSGESTARDMSDAEDTPPTWDFLIQMMDEGENVTINYAWKNIQDNQWYSHAVCMTGAREYSPSGAKRISFRHDGIQGSSGGLRHDHLDVTVDEEGWMRFGPGNSKYITRAIANSPLLPEDSEKSGFLNEVYNFLGLGKAYGPLDTEEDFVEIVLNESVMDLENYRITFYNGSDGKAYHAKTLDQFQAGSVTHGLQTYTCSLADTPLVSDFGGISLAYTGSVISGQFLSYGGTFTAADGDAKGFTSVNMGALDANTSLILTGTGERYSHFTWSVSDSATPGDVNTGQIFDEFVTGVSDQPKQKPGGFRPGQNYPNPFNPGTTIRYEIPEAASVTLSVFNTSGERVYRVFESGLNAGRHSFNWDAGQLPSGFYIYTVQVNAASGQTYSGTGKMLLMK
ncbi:MAG: T9SS type A sorting domain-containing protein [candidate division KSB1 bacterium]|nr:T9SS type A sorting domain-containing protein [candidate division KSB1 bacterium]